MRCHLLTVALLSACASGMDHPGGGGGGPPVNVPVTASPSGSFRGTEMRSRRGRLLEGYRGIRYAEPPVGELRFQPPKPILKYSGEVNATLDGPACPQPTYGDYYVDEDCLRLNVYTPAEKGQALPVLVFFHAGGFYSVSGRSDVAGPDYLLDRDLVLVTVNYRLASLGFLSTGDKLAPGNNGFKDQVVALRWVQRNIAAFGGDPGLVTIAGYSAGAFSVMLHMVSPMSGGLFHRAISMSGSPISQIKLPHHQKELAVKQAELVNCPTGSSKQILDCLKTKTSKELGDSLVGFFGFNYDPVLVWVPLVEEDYGQERFLTMDPRESIRQGKIHAVPFIVSQTTDEFFWKAFTVTKNETLRKKMNEEWYSIAPVSFYLPEPSRPAAERLREAYLHNKPLADDDESASALGKLYNDAIIGFGVHTMMNLIAKYSPRPVWYYQFAYIGNHSHYEDPITKKPVGAAHHDDLIYLFSINVSFPFIAVDGSNDSAMVDMMTGIFYNFMKNGDPNSPQLGAPAWPAATPSSRVFLRIADQPSLDHNMFEDRFKVWEEFYPLEGKQVANT